MTSPEHISDPLFWPFVIFAVVVLAFLLAMTRVIELLVHRERGQGHPSEGKVASATVNLLELRALLLSLFRVEDLRPFLHLHLGGEGQAVVQTLCRAGLSDDALVYEIFVALQQRGLLGDAFFDALVAERPRREPDIRRVQRGGTANQWAA